VIDTACVIDTAFVIDTAWTQVTPNYLRRDTRSRIAFPAIR
jgi:hypothetical protein